MMNLKVLSIALSFLGVMLFSLVSCTSNKSDKNEELQKSNTMKLESNQAKVDTVIIEGMQFKPAELVIHKGDKVVWVNKDIVVHDVSQHPDKTWTSGNLEINATYTMTPKKELDYFCSIHPTMKAKVRFEK